MSLCSGNLYIRSTAFRLLFVVTDMSSLSSKRGVIESREDALRRYFDEGCDVSHFIVRESVSSYAGNLRQKHDVLKHDRGYVVFNDFAMNR